MEEIVLPQIFCSILGCPRVEGFARIFRGLNAIEDMELRVCLLQSSSCRMRTFLSQLAWQ